MKVLDPGHLYMLNILDAPNRASVLRFVKREGPGYPGNAGHHPGTTIQEVMRAVINRLRYVNNQIPDIHTTKSILLAEQIVFELETRAAIRHKREKPRSWADAVEGPTCKKCGHVGCKGTCH